jgi:hypothetical protein
MASPAQVPLRSIVIALLALTLLTCGLPGLLLTRSSVVNEEVGEPLNLLVRGAQRL